MAFLLSHLLEESAAKYPSNEAVSFDGQSISYRELDRQSNRLARALQSAGVGRQDRVGVLFEKSILPVIAIFAVLKAGATYVPLDASAPPSRLGFILRNCGARALVASARTRGLPEVVAECPTLSLLLLEGEAAQSLGEVPALSWKAALGESDAPLNASNIEQDVAYILYTSGSTGQPKGVQISHRNALSFIGWAAAAVSLGPEDRVSNHAPFHFDLSIFDLYATVKAGATICPVPPETAKFPIELGRFIESERISVWYSVPSALTLLLERGKIERLNLSRLRTVLFAGEVFPTKHLRSLMEQVPHPRYYNLYGPTETNVITWYEVPAPPSGSQPIPIGKACANADVFALDDTGALVSEPGREGELYARGPTVALGYYGDPDRTASVFVSDPLRSDSPSKVYRTGDRVSLDGDGNYLFLGRTDFQVKVQGYRIELGEIEATVLAHEAVEEVAVVAASDGEDSSYLLAYVVLRRTAALTGEEIRRYCSLTLPPYMVPRSVDFIDALPRTANGKIDRVRLSTSRQGSESGST